ncbi:MAG: hypothetical protein J7L96_09060 [Bacteroidales bacterium]|nr:hypothetical protein [Bacteroidales bacterium]
MKKSLWSIKMANWTWILIAGGTFMFWFAGFISHYSPLYTLYWPLPADFSQFSVWGGAFMGMAGLKGMLRRTLYINGEYNTYMILAAVSGALLLIAFLVFFYNIVMSLGLKGVIGIFQPSKLKTKDLVPQKS